MDHPAPPPRASAVGGNGVNMQVPESSALSPGTRYTLDYVRVYSLPTAPPCAPVASSGLGAEVLPALGGATAFALLLLAANYCVGQKAGGRRQSLLKGRPPPGVNELVERGARVSSAL